MGRFETDERVKSLWGVSEGKSVRLPEGTYIFVPPHRHSEVYKFADQRKLSPRHVVVCSSFEERIAHV